MPASKKGVFETLSKIPVGDYVKHSKAEDHDGRVTYLPYLPWTHAHQLMMAHYPEYEWSFSENPEGLEVFYFKDGTAEVRVVMSIGDVTMIASKTVTNGTGKAYPNPNANDIHNAKMRCRTRAMAELGLGWDLWINPENYPYEEPKSVVKEALKKAEESKAEKPAQSKAEELFLSLVEIDDEKVAKANFRKVKTAWKNRKMDMDELERRWSELKTKRKWK
jgi:hypothetical protein